MKRIIKGKTYNTETAEVVARGHTGAQVQDIHRKHEELYITPKGNYFIHDEFGNIIIVNDDLSLNGNPYISSVNNVIEWLEEWNVSQLEPREMKAFGIVDA